MKRNGFCILIDTFFQGPVPSVREGEDDHVVVFNTQREAELEIVDFMQTRLQEFIEGQRDFEDAITVEEYVVPVEILPDGRILGSDGAVIGKTGGSEDGRM
jgi:hypothetical protein